jgi:hypothetical protein
VCGAAGFPISGSFIHRGSVGSTFLANRLSNLGRPVIASGGQRQSTYCLS